MDPWSRQTLSLPRAERDAQFSPSRVAKDAPGYLGGMVAATAAARDDPAIACRTDISYGPRPRMALDVYRPAGAGPAPLPAILFIHGGFWQEGDKSVAGFAARTATDQGLGWVGLGYTLAPQARLRDIVGEIGEALAFLKSEGSAFGVDAGRVILAGHSAGAHMAACMLCDLPAGVGALRPAGAVLVSGVYELAPVAASYVDAPLALNAAAIADLSPLRHLPRHVVPTHILVGGDEPQAFRLQSRALAETWGTAMPQLTTEVAGGRDHFDVLEALKDPGSPTWAAIRALLDRDAPQPPTDD